MAKKVEPTMMQLHQKAFQLLAVKDACLFLRVPVLSKKKEEAKETAEAVGADERTAPEPAAAEGERTAPEPAALAGEAAPAAPAPAADNDDDDEW